MNLRHLLVYCAVTLTIITITHGSQPPEYVSDEHVSAIDAALTAISHVFLDITTDEYADIDDDCVQAVRLYQLGSPFLDPKAAEILGKWANETDDDTSLTDLYFMMRQRLCKHIKPDHIQLTFTMKCMATGKCDNCRFESLRITSHRHDALTLGGSEVDGEQRVSDLIEPHDKLYQICTLCERPSFTVTDRQYSDQPTQITVLVEDDCKVKVERTIWHDTVSYELRAILVSVNKRPDEWPGVITIDHGLAALSVSDHIEVFDVEEFDFQAQQSFQPVLLIYNQVNQQLFHGKPVDLFSESVDRVGGEGGYLLPMLIFLSHYLDNTEYSTSDVVMVEELMSTIRDKRLPNRKDLEDLHKLLISDDYYKNKYLTIKDGYRCGLIVERLIGLMSHSFVNESGLMLTFGGRFQCRACRRFTGNQTTRAVCLPIVIKKETNNLQDLVDKQYPVDRPSLCAYCDSNNRKRSVLIGLPETFLFVDLQRKSKSESVEVPDRLRVFKTTYKRLVAVFGSDDDTDSVVVWMRTKNGLWIRVTDSGIHYDEPYDSLGEGEYCSLLVYKKN